MKFEFATANRIIFGPGALSDIGALARPLGDRAFILTGRDPSRAEALRALLQAAGVSSEIFAVPGEPTIDLAEEAAASARNAGANVIVGFGGGSALDAAKAVAALLANDGQLLDYLEIIGRNKPLERPSLPCIAIPTTAGTGSEVTRNAVLASPHHKLKVSLRSPSMLPRIALVDPLLTHSLPPSVTAFTGMDALTQLIEPFVCTRANPFTDGLCREGLMRAARSLLATYRNGGDAAAREDMSVASLFGGMSLANAGLGAVHGLAGPIGGMFDAAHGALCAALLPHVMRANISQTRDAGRFAEIAQIFTGRRDATADDGAEWVASVVSDLKIPPLSTYGIRREHFTEIAEKAAASNSMKANPVQLSIGELNGILEKAL